MVTGISARCARPDRTRVRPLGGRMSEHASAGELLWVGFDGTDAPAELLERIADHRVGGVLLFGRNVKEPGQVAQLCNRLQAAVAAGQPPLPVAIDQEGGRVQRLRAPAT